LQNNGPNEFGYNTATWNGAILKEYIEKRYHVTYKKVQVYNLLKELGFTYQKGRAKYPERMSRKKRSLKRHKKTKRGTG
jgi:transposase